MKQSKEKISRDIKSLDASQSHSVSSWIVSHLELKWLLTEELELHRDGVGIECMIAASSSPRALSIAFDMMDQFVGGYDEIASDMGRAASVVFDLGDESDQKAENLTDKIVVRDLTADEISAIRNFYKLSSTATRAVIDLKSQLIEKIQPLMDSDGGDSPRFAQLKLLSEDFRHDYPPWLQFKEWPPVHR